MKLLKKLVLFMLCGTVKPNQLKNQIDKIMALGFDGLVFQTDNCSDDEIEEKGLKLLSDGVHHVKSLGGECYICDNELEKYKENLSKECFSEIDGFYSDDIICEHDVLARWCEENEKIYAANFKNCDTPLVQIYRGTSELQTLKNIPLPGMKFYGRKIGNSYTPRLASSVARQFGDGTAFCSVFSGSGWGLSPSEFEDYLRHLIECGINTFIFCAARTNMSYFNIIDYPPSFPLHITWKSALPSIFEKLDKIAEIEFNRPRNILLITPMQALYDSYKPLDMNINTEVYALSDKTIEICDRLHEMGRRFDLTDENIFELEISFDEKGMNIGNASYSTVLITPGAQLSKKGMMYIERAKANGVRILSDIPTSDTDVIPIEFIKEQLQKVVPIEISQSDWSVTYPKNNRLYLIPNQIGENATLAFETDEDFSSDSVKLLLSDDVKTVSINNIIVTPQKTDEYGTYYDITNNILSGKNTILLEKCRWVYASLIGDFKVISQNGYLVFDERQVQTSYDFILKTSSLESNAYLTECGYPFCNEAVTAKKIIEVSENILDPYIKIDCASVSAMKVSFDGEDIGYVYGKRNTLPLPPLEASRQHLIEVTAYSSAYNAYGPHFYYKGDSSFITPGQFLGKKNFADDTYAPEVTSNHRMKLMLWSLPDNIEIVRKF